MPRSMSDGEDSTRVPKGSRGISGIEKGTSKNRTPKRSSSVTTKFQGFMDSRAENSDRNQSAR